MQIALLFIRHYIILSNFEEKPTMPLPSIKCMDHTINKFKPENYQWNVRKVETQLRSTESELRVHEASWLVRLMGIL